MFNTILIATDGSNHAYRALDVASDLAVKYQAKLIILHVQMHGEVPTGFRQMDQVEHASGTEKSAFSGLYNFPGNLTVAFTDIDPDVTEDHYFHFVGDAILNDSKDKAKLMGVTNIQPMVSKWKSADQILQVAENEKADLIVMGTRGLSDVKELLMGSVASKVTQLSECPCLSVK